jgi:hypothetical protein
LSLRFGFVCVHIGGLKMGYHIAGIISTMLFLLDLAGKWAQLREVWKRRRHTMPDRWRDTTIMDCQRPTAVLSLNLLTMVFVSSYLLVVYGVSLPRFNHYLVWSRLISSVVVLMILYEIVIDRRTRGAKAIFWACAAALGGLVILSNYRRIAIEAILVPQILMVVIAVILAQGNLHQIVLIRRTRQTGAVSLRSAQFVILKDLGAVAFAITMGLAAGWPIILVSGSSAVLTLALAWHFRWVRNVTAPEAAMSVAGLASSPRNSGSVR